LTSRINNVKWGGKEIQLNIWDTGGQERFEAITKSYYNGAHGIVMVYDSTCEDTFRNLPKWLKTVEECAPEDAVRILVANKVDREEFSVPNDSGMDFADNNGLHFLECSAKTGLNVHEIFEKVL
jgi:small GTP-binding protein